MATDEWTSEFRVPALALPRSTPVAGGRLMANVAQSQSHSSTDHYLFHLFVGYGSCISDHLTSCSCFVARHRSRTTDRGVLLDRSRLCLVVKSTPVRGGARSLLHKRFHMRQARSRDVRNHESSCGRYVECLCCRGVCRPDHRKTG